MVSKIQLENLWYFLCFVFQPFYFLMVVLAFCFFHLFIFLWFFLVYFSTIIIVSIYLKFLERKKDNHLPDQSLMYYPVPTNIMIITNNPYKININRSFHIYFTNDTFILLYLRCWSFACFSEFLN